MEVALAEMKRAGLLIEHNLREARRGGHIGIAQEYSRMLGQLQYKAAMTEKVLRAPSTSYCESCKVSHPTHLIVNAYCVGCGSPLAKKRLNAKPSNSDRVEFR